jgi:formyl-CoA transferase
VFRRLSGLMDAPELAADERFATHGARGANMEELDRIISEWTAKYEADDLLRLLSEGGVPAGRIYRAKDMVADPHFRAREAIVRIAHNVFGEIPMQNVFPKLSATPGRIRSVGPELGQDNAAVYGDLLGLSAEEIERLHASGVI